VVRGMKPRASCMLGKRCTAEPHLQTIVNLFQCMQWAESAKLNSKNPTFWLKFFIFFQLNLRDLEQNFSSSRTLIIKGQLLVCFWKKLAKNTGLLSYYPICPSTDPSTRLCLILSLRGYNLGLSWLSRLREGLTSQSVFYMLLWLFLFLPVDKETTQIG
jgi:hypothetical protein